MEVILINDSKLKVMLSKSELAEYAISVDDLDLDSDASRKAFWEILRDAKAETGFETAHNRLFVQAYPSKDGGCELYVTCLPIPEGDMEAKRGVKPVCYVYGFPNLKQLLQLCALLCRAGYQEESCAYTAAETEGCFLLLHDGVANDRPPVEEAYPFLPEYGERKRGSAVFSYLNEHCTCFCPQQAVQTLAKFT